MYTNMHVRFTTNTLENAKAFLKAFVENFDEIKDVEESSEEKEYPSYIEGSETVKYADCVVVFQVETATLSDYMDNIPSFLKTAADPENKWIPSINEDWSVSLFMNDKPNGDQIQEAVFHLYRSSQNADSYIKALEDQNSLMHKRMITVEQRMTLLEEKYAGLVSFINNGIDLKRMMNVVIETANAVDEDILNRNQYHAFMYQ